MRTLHPFHGGVCPPERKTLSSEAPLRPAGIPPQLVLPLSQHVGPSGAPRVQAGDRVLGGQRLTDLHGLPVHAPTSGRVRAIEARVLPHPSGLGDRCIVIDCDGEDRWQPLDGCADYRSLDPASLRQRLFEAGLAGLGGAGFPTAHKLAAQRPMDTLLINGAECEPYITADDRLMRERAAAVLSGADILACACGAREILIGVEDNKPAAIAALRAALAGRDDIEIAVIPTRYPSGGEKQLIEILTGRQVPSGGLPADLGILCQNVGTAAAAHDAIVDGRPLVSRIVTVTGEALRSPGNYRVLLGTPMRYLLQLAGLQPQPAQRLIMGGPMMGVALTDARAPVIKTSNCLLLPGAGELSPAPAAQPCIRCGLCAEVCPARLLPQQLYWYARAEQHEQLQQHKLFDCIECGACSWVCPSHIPLVQYYRASKGAIRDAQAASAKSEHARERFEARQARLEREAAEKAARRAQRKRAAAARAGKPSTAAAGNSEDPIQAAIARARAKRAARAGGDDAAAQSREQLARIEARLAKARARLAADDGADPATSAALRKAVSTTEAKLEAARGATAAGETERDPA